MVVKLFIKRRGKTRKIKRKTRRNGGRRQYSRKINAVRRRLKGGNYSTDITKEQFQGVDIVNDNKTVVAYPGGVMNLKQYKKKLEDNDVDGFNPLD
jgi:hypothetical protein